MPLPAVLLRHAPKPLQIHFIGISAPKCAGLCAIKQGNLVDLEHKVRDTSEGAGPTDTVTKTGQGIFVHLRVWTLFASCCLPSHPSAALPEILLLCHAL